MKYIKKIVLKYSLYFYTLTKKLHSNISIQIINLSFLDQYKVHILIAFIYS